MTEEDNIIRQERPHEVTIPEGSHMAVAKTAAQQEASVRKVYQNEGGEEVEHIAPDKFVSDASDTLQGVPDRFVGEDSSLNTRGADALPAPIQAKGPAGLEIAPEHRVGVADPAVPPEFQGRESVARPVGSPSQEVAPTAPAQALASASESLHGEHREPVVPKDMPEMDFPARVVHLHIENENLRKRLDDLDADR